MKFKTGAMGLIAALFLVSSVYADQGVNQPDTSTKQSDSGQLGDLGGSNPPGADVGAGGQGSNSQSGSSLNGSGGSQQGDMGAGSQQGTDLGGATQGGSMQQGASTPGQKQAGWPSAAGVQQIQQKLNEQGYNVGPVDGKFGPKTKEALRQFQEKQGIQPTGQADQQTMAALGIQNQGSQGTDQPGSVQPGQSGDMGAGPPDMGSQSNPQQGDFGSDSSSGSVTPEFQGSDSQQESGIQESASPGSPSDSQMESTDQQNSEAGARQQ